ncbi:unnamed protein product [Amoebophrya sp. A120]|nr:unnamed protein product [Amoebophrya sp. A120]|eukprot:GSA120T00003109001.1
MNVTTTVKKQDLFMHTGLAVACGCGMRLSRDSLGRCAPYDSLSRDSLLLSTTTVKRKTSLLT